tara:strand:- start:798 stop:926 length:129 start_codon:yes stop_codon:yes gene_type:complete
MIKVLKNFKVYEMEKKINIIIMCLKDKFLYKYNTQQELLDYQ